MNNIEKEKDSANKIFKSGKLDEAIAAYTKLLEFDPTNKKFNSVIHANRSVCYKKLNKNIVDKLVKKAKLLSVYHNLVENDEQEAYTRNWHIAFA